MTRDQACKIYIRIMYPHPATVIAEIPEWVYRQLDAFAAIGMIKFDENPKSAQNKAAEMFRNSNAYMSAKTIIQVVDDAGLKIVEK